MFTLESELGRICCNLSIRTVNEKATNRRLKTSGYRRIVCRLASITSYRDATRIFNETYHRLRTKDELSYGTLAQDVEQEGQLLINAKKRRTREILTQFGFDPDTGLYPNEELPEVYRNNACEIIEFEYEKLMRETIPGWKGADTEIDSPDEGELDSEVSEPDIEVIHVESKRRGHRVEVPAEDKEALCASFARWYNSVSQKEMYGIIHSWSIEKQAKDVVYISADAVLVDKQPKYRNTKTVMNAKELSQKEESEKMISHMNIKIENGDFRYYITSTDMQQAFEEAVAVILKNGLYKKYMVFFIDGEIALADNIKKYFGKWSHVVYLDWMHLEHKVYDRLSNALKSKRVDDPRGNVEYYVKGPKKGQVKTQDQTSISRLYARAVIRILWVGNVDEAIAYLRSIPKDMIANQKELNRLVEYLNNKRKWIPCYALRKKAGLRNSSNGVEGLNRLNVADRQKHNGTSWRPEGSSYLAAISTLFANGEDENWFEKGELAFS